LIGSSVFHPLIKDHVNGLTVGIDMESIISVSYEGIDVSGGKYFVRKRLK